MESITNATIADRAWACAIRFNALVSSANNKSSPEFEDQLARFNIWAANIGAFAEAHASLDYRLRSSPKVKTMMTQLLEALRRKLQRALDFEGKNKRKDLDTTLDDIDLKLDDGQSQSSQSETNSTSSSYSVQTSVSDTSSMPLLKTLKDVEAAVDRLHRLGMTIRRTSTHHQNLTASKYALRDETGDDTSAQFENFALQRVQAKFPAANTILHHRLANVILQRRKWLTYQKQHQQKLALFVQPTSRHSIPQQRSRTFQAMQFAQSSQGGTSTGGKTFLPEIALGTALSTTTASALTVSRVLSRPPSIASSTAASSSVGISALSFPSVPKVPQYAKEFQCPYCGLMLGIKEGKSKRWRKHIISDLEPYICLFENCATVNQPYRTVGDWVKHMQWEHTLQWHCRASNCQNQVFDEQAAFEHHMELLHSETFTSSQLPMLVESSRRPAAELFECCPLCKYMLVAQQTSDGDQRNNDYLEKANHLHKHIATHLEELALISLPWQDDINEISSSRDTPSNGRRISLNSIGVGGLDDISLAFDDPPEFEFSKDEQPEAEILPHSIESPDISQGPEWGFLPLLHYDGHLQDPLLQSLILNYMSTHIEEPGLREAKPSIDSTLVVGFTRDKEHQTICDWISPLSFAEKHEHVLAMVRDGTCEWFLQIPEFRSWIARAEKVLWAPGIPGSGKTVLASAIIDYLKNYKSSASDSDIEDSRRAVVAYVYCDYRLQESQTTMGLVACLLRQLLEGLWEVSTAIPHDVQATYDLHKQAKTGPYIAEYLEMITSTIVDCGSVFVVIDALDECTQDTRRELIEILRSIEPSIQILITSRHLGDIKEKFGNVSRVEVSAPKADLESYAQGCIERYPALGPYWGTLEYETKEELMRNIVQKAAGMFHVVQLLIQSWVDDPLPWPLGRLPSLPGVPREIDLFYDEIMERISDQPNPDVMLARLVLIWIAFSTRPLTVREITHAIDTQVFSDVIASRPEVKQDSELLTTVCAGILAIDSETDILRPAHFTLREYFQRKREEKFSQGEEYITASCVEYLLLEEFKAGPCISDDAMITRLRQYPFLSYAASEWGHHARGAAEMACNKPIITFLKHKLAVEAALQAKSITLDWQSYPQNIDSQSYPHGVPGIAFAALFGLETTVGAILNSDDETSSDDKAKALFWAATGGSHEVVKLLLARGVSPNVPGALRAAAENGHESVIRILLANGADVNANGIGDTNALQAAAIKGNESIIRLLLENGADPNIEGEELGSILHIAAVNGDESVTQILLKHGADPNTKGGMYKFALQAAVEEGHESIVRMLLDHGADANLEGGPYGNALQAAAENGDKNIVELLLAHGADVNVKIGGERYTALQEVARRGLEEMVALLIDNGANIGSQQRNGQTALHQAAKEGQAGAVAMLLNRGANLNTRDERGFTALDWARKKNFVEVVKVLEAGRQQQR